MLVTITIAFLSSNIRYDSSAQFRANATDIN